MTRIGTFQTAHASKYMQQLLKHFAHKVEVRYDDTQGHAAMPLGPAEFRASDAALTITVSAADDAGLEMAMAVIDDHLVRFAFREGFEKMDWATSVP